MEVTLATNSKLTSIAIDPLHNGLADCHFYAQGIKFRYAWSVEVGPVDVKLTDKSKFTDKMAQELGNIKGRLGVWLFAKGCLLDNAPPSATTVDGYLLDRGIMERIVEIVGKNPGGDITFHWFNENLTVKGLKKAPTHSRYNKDGKMWVADVPDDYWRAVPNRLFKLSPGVLGPIQHDTFSATIRLVFE